LVKTVAKCHMASGDSSSMRFLPLLYLLPLMPYPP
jgi:hypothetical protein